MSEKRRPPVGRPANPNTTRSGSAQARGPASSDPAQSSGTPARIGLLVVILILIAVVVIGSDFIIGAISGAGSGPTQTATPIPSSQAGVVVPGLGGHWIDVNPDQLASMLGHKDFTLLNVKTPYIGEIDRTDLIIPYDQVATRSSELPSDKTARILVYCKTGRSSAVAAQTLLDLGYGNVWNLAGGMDAWQASGRGLVKRDRS